MVAADMPAALSNYQAHLSIAGVFFVIAARQTGARALQLIHCSAAAARLDMNQADFRNGISVNRLTGMDVRGQKGNQLGEVQDVIFSSDGKVQAITFKSGGFAYVGDALFRVGWNELKFDNAMNRVTVSLTEQTVERYQERGQPDQMKRGANEFRASSVIGYAATLRDGSRWGEVQDMIVTRNG